MLISLCLLYIQIQSTFQMHKSLRIVCRIRLIEIHNNYGCLQSSQMQTIKYFTSTLQGSYYNVLDMDLFASQMVKNVTIYFITFSFDMVWNKIAEFFQREKIKYIVLCHIFTHSID